MPFGGLNLGGKRLTFSRGLFTSFSTFFDTTTLLGVKTEGIFDTPTRAVDNLGDLLYLPNGPCGPGGNLRLGSNFLNSGPNYFLGGFSTPTAVETSAHRNDRS